MRWAVATLFLAQALGIVGCTEPARRPRAAYLLVDAARLRSGPARAVVNHLLSALQPGDSFGIACLGTGNFSDRDAVVSLSLDARPSLATQQKGLLKKKFDEFTPPPRSAGHLDIAGGLLYAVAQLVISMDLGSGELTARREAVALKRLEAWGEWVEKGGGEWRVVHDLALLETIFPGS
jgi:hypothetical protein